MADWHAGMRVVYVDDRGDNPRQIWMNGEAPTIGAVYTVARVAVNVRGTVCLILAELPRHPTSIAVGLYGHAAWRFRPVRETKTDISIFRKLVEPSELARVSIDG